MNVALRLQFFLSTLTAIALAFCGLMTLALDLAFLQLGNLLDHVMFGTLIAAAWCYWRARLWDRRRELAEQRKSAARKNSSSPETISFC